MAEAKKKQQSSPMLKWLLIGGVVVIAYVYLSPTTEPPKSTKTPQLATSSKKKTELYNDTDRTVQFAPIEASLKNSFVPLVTKKDVNGPVSPGTIPASFVNGETTWTYTGNMTVDGVPNALFENSATGEGVFLRPGEHWKQLRLVTVREDSVEIEGPSGAMKTVYFEDFSVPGPKAFTDAPLPPLPPTMPNNNGGGFGSFNQGQGNNPGNNNNGGGGGGRRRGRNQGQPQANEVQMTGPIGSGGPFETSVDVPTP